MVSMALSPSPSPSTDCNDEDIEHILLVIVLVVLANVAMLLLHALGSLRRQSSHTLLHNIVSGIDALSYPLVSYTIGLMSNKNYCYVLDFTVWAVFMLLLLGSTDNLTACRLHDIDNWKSIYVKHLIKGLLVVYIVVNISRWQISDGFPYLKPLVAILFVSFIKWYLRIASMRMASKSYLSKNMKVIDKYMQREDKDSLNLLGSFDPVTMEGYKYMVAGENDNIKSARQTPQDEQKAFKGITVEQIWRCTGNLLRLELGNLLKDMCLSMALSKMLNRRFAGFKLWEAGLEKTHDFVFKGLLAGDKPYQRAFRVIEEELVFVHDIYYTRYSYFYQKIRYLAFCLPIIMFGLCSWLTYEIVDNRRHQPVEMLKLTIFITVVLAFLEVYQLYLYIASGWFKVALIQSYVTRPCLQTSGCFLEKVVGLLLRLKAFRPWKNRLGQYCILWEVGHKGRLRKCLHYATLRLVDKKVKTGRNNSVKLSENLKKAVIDSLLRSNGHLTNGVTSLQNNAIDSYLPAWACDSMATDGSITRTILVWHIATFLCKHHLEAQAKEEKEDAGREDMVTTATTLSQYCMHLLAFSPDILPDHSTISESILDQTIDEADKILNGCKKKENMCDKLLKYNTHKGDGDEAQLFVKGILLARHLIKDIQEPTLRWKVISEFWAEMMLYVSPSDNARAHLEALARGGEFITHLWALLTHAGVLNRGPIGP